MRATKSDLKWKLGELGGLIVFPGVAGPTEAPAKPID
jgi:hypothetical protein